MALKEYKKKRSFSKTPEPVGGKPSGTALQFVVQKHAASHLHYDFRLEMDGVLKSWAIPKGPSLNPADKRLAMMVEDHPFDYKNFEGIIPAGNYGAGTVIVWDEGTYEPLEIPGKGSSAATSRSGKAGAAKKPGNDRAGASALSKAAQEKILMQALKTGSLKIKMYGKKLKGEFALVHTHGWGENSWLLIKHRDQYASEEPITEKDKSVVSKKTLEQVAANPRSKEWISNKAAAKSSANGKVTASKKPPRKSPMPADLEPMLATLVDKPFDEEGWMYEIKFDGYRALSYLNKGKVEIRSRNNKSFDEKFYPVYDALKKWKLNALLDGEIVVMNEKGLSRFGALQNWRSEADGELAYYLFDILWHDGEDLTQLPLEQRRELLQTLKLPQGNTIRISENFEASGTEFFATAQKMGLEGIIAKKADSLYFPGARSKEWLKIKTALRQEVVIGGYTRNEGSSKLFSSLLVGVFEKGKLQYTGKIGTGFTEKMQKEMMRQFKPLIVPKSPFGSEPDINKPSRFRPDPPHANAVWLKPRLIGEVSYREMTGDGVMRHPSFEGMREDKAAADVVRERALPTPKLVKAAKTTKTKKMAKPEKPAKSPGATIREEAGKKTAKKTTNSGKMAQSKMAEQKVLAPARSGERKTLLNPGDESQARQVNGHELSFTHLSKIFWPREKFTKRDLINYYYQVAPYILPYLKDRPQSLNRHPNGIDGKSFYQKDVTGKVPDWIATFPYHSNGDEQDKNFLVCTDEASLLYMASLACIELNPWSSRVNAPDNPDWCIIDLDPDKKTPFQQVIEAAQITKKVLDTIGVESYCKTSGSTGMHIYFPLGAKYTYEQSKEFARFVVKIVHAEIPAYTSIERMTGNRKGKMYLDFLQNRPQATIAAPYSARPKPGATVSAPLHWEEVKKGLSIQDFTIRNMPQRLKSEGDLFKPVLGKGIDMQKVLKKLEA
ncbi:MAG TPA: DNA ligase D, partial [Puia sp.]|nr:DNA ligase D [Puia sp.]